MKNEFLEIINKYDTGLIPYSLPTGYGKSYWTRITMCDYVLNGGDKKMFYVTPQKKNFDFNKFKEIYEDNNKGEDFKKDVLVLKSNLDCVIDAFNNEDIFDDNNTDIPSKIKDSDEYRTLIQELKKLNQKLDWNYQRIVEDDLRKKYEPKFRSLIHVYLKKYKSPEKRKKMVTKDSKYGWLRKIYPQIAFDKAKIVLLTSKKLVSKVDLIYQETVDTLDQSIIHNAIIFLDEFDSIKQDITDSLIDNSLNYKTDILHMFLNIHDRLNNHVISATYDSYIYESYDKYNSLISEMNIIFNDFNLRCNYKTKDVTGDEKNFIFNDCLTNLIVQDNKTNILIIKKDNVNEIWFLDKEKYEDNNDEVISVFQLLGQMNQFLNKLSYFIYEIATKRYKNIKDENERGNLDNVIKSIYDEFGADEETKLFMLNNHKKRYKTISYNKFFDGTFYNQGFNYYRFIDDDSHEHRTKLQYYDFQNTAEKILIYLCVNNLVFGMSATANVDSVISNFDMNHIRKKLGSDYLLPGNREDVVGYLNDLKQEYEKNINVTAEIVSAEGSIREQFKELFVNKAKYFLGETSFGDNHYFQERYLKIFKVMKEFIDSDLQSFLCVNNILAKEKEEFSKELFKAAFKKLSKNKEKLIFLDSTNFDSNKRELLNRLSKGEKIFVMTAYATIGKGQNLTYSIDSLNQENLRVLKKVDDDRTKEKDFDGIYLGEITNVIPYDVKSNDDSSIYNLLIILESLYERGEIHSYKKLQRYITYVFKNDKNNLNPIRKTLSFKNYLTHEIIQTVGRLNRTYVKNKDVKILIDEKLTHKVGLEIDRDLSTPEVIAVFDKLSEYDKEDKTNRTKMIQYETQRKCTQSLRLIQHFLHHEWDDVKINEWQKLREAVLKHPITNNLDVIELINKQKIDYYISNDTQIDKYYFSQNYEYSAISLSFTSKEDLKKELNNEEAVIQEASFENCSLDIIMKNEAIKQMFKSSGYATTFVPGKYMISPVIYNNIYKGALGEVVGRFILETNLNIKLEELEKEHYEYFDNKYHNYYFDFKHWNVNTTFKETEMLKKIDRKLSSIGGNAKAIIINIVNRGDQYVDTTYRNILVIPCLINQDGSLNITNLHQIGGFINENNHE